jgi:hypothetical protein
MKARPRPKRSQSSIATELWPIDNPRSYQRTQGWGSVQLRKQRLAHDLIKVNEGVAHGPAIFQAHGKANTPTVNEVEETASAAQQHQRDTDLRVPGHARLRHDPWRLPRYFHATHSPFFLHHPPTVAALAGPAQDDRLCTWGRVLRGGGLL